MNELDRLRQDVLSLLDRIRTVLADEMPEAAVRMLAAGRERLAAGRYYVVVCGEFRQGKSSLLNALVERPGLFPVDLDVTTATVTVLEWAPSPRAVIHFAEDPDDPAATAPAVEVTLDQVREYVTEQGNPGNEKRVALVELGVPLEPLRGGLILVDTPGIGSVNPAHTAATRAFLPRADALIFVSSAVEPLGTPELDFLGYALEQCPTVLVAITLTDKVVEPAPVVAAARARIAELTGRDPQKLTVLPVSAYRKNSALADEDPGLLDESGFPALEEELWGSLAATCGARQIQRELDNAAALVDGAMTPVATELTALAEENLDGVSAEIEAARAAAEKLRAEAHGWRRGLRADMELAARAARDRLGQDFDRIGDQFRRSLETDEAVNDPAAVARRVSDAIVDAGTRAHDELARIATDLATRYSQRLAISAPHPRVGDIVDTPALGEPRRARDGGPSRFAMFRTGWSGSMAYGGAGTIIGAVVGSFVPVVGTILGGIVGGTVGQITGWFAGRKEARQQAERRRRQEQVAVLRDQILPMIDASRRRAERQFTYQVNDYVDALTHALEEQVSAQSESLAMTERRLVEARARTVAQRTDRVAELDDRLATYAGLQEQIDQARGRVAELSRRPGHGSAATEG